MAAFPDLPISFPLVRIPAFDTQIIGYGGKVEQRIARQSSPRYTIKVNFNYLDDVNLSTLEAFFLARKGSLESFTITDERNVQHTVRFKEDSINLEYFLWKAYSAKEIELIEVSS